MVPSLLSPTSSLPWMAKPKALEAEEEGWLEAAPGEGEALLLSACVFPQCSELLGTERQWLPQAVSYQGKPEERKAQKALSPGDSRK